MAVLSHVLLRLAASSLPFGDYSLLAVLMRWAQRHSNPEFGRDYHALAGGQDKRVNKCIRWLVVARVNVSQRLFSKSPP